MRPKKIYNCRWRLLAFPESPLHHRKLILIGQFKTPILYLFEMRKTLLNSPWCCSPRCSIKSINLFCSKHFDLLGGSQIKYSRSNLHISKIKKLFSVRLEPQTQESMVIYGPYNSVYLFSISSSFILLPVLMIKWISITKWPITGCPAFRIITTAHHKWKSKNLSFALTLFLPPNYQFFPFYFLQNPISAYFPNYRNQSYSTPLHFRMETFKWNILNDFKS